MRITLTLLLLAVSAGAGCSGRPLADTDPYNIIVELSETMPTIIHVRWSTRAVTTGAVAFSGDDLITADLVSPGTPPGTEHSATLVGMPQDAEINVTVAVLDGGASNFIPITTGTLSDPVQTELVTDSNLWDLFVLVPVLTPRDSRIVLLDYKGRVTWQHVVRSGLPVFRALVRQDGRGIVYVSASEPGIPASTSEIVKVSWDGVEEVVLSVPGLANDFVEEEDGSIVALAYESRGDVLGNQLVRVGTDGGATELWSTWDCYDPEIHPGADPQLGWTAANALDADDGDWLISLGNLSSIVRVEPKGRTCPWAYGGIVGTAALVGEPYAHQNQFELFYSSTLIVFDNEGPAKPWSRIIEYDIVNDGHTLQQTGQILADPPLYSSALGDVHRLPLINEIYPGDTLVVWSSPGVIDRYAWDNITLRGRVALVGAGTFGFAHAIPDQPVPGWPHTY